MTELQKIAQDFGVEYDDVVQMSLASHGRYGGLSSERKAKVSEAGLRIFKALGSDTARTCYLKIRDVVAPEHLKGIAA